MSLIAPTLQSFFTERLTKQRMASPKTIAVYRDSLRLLVVFVHERTGKQPFSLDWDDLDTEMISAFLDHLETERGNTPRTRNLRLTAIRSLFAYASLRHPEHAALIGRVLAYNWSYATAYRIGLHAVTLPLLFSSIAAVLPIGGFSLPFMSAFLTMLIVYMNYKDKLVPNEAPRKGETPQNNNTSE